MYRIYPAARRLAVIGCIYGNVPAFQACLADARTAESCLANQFITGRWAWVPSTVPTHQEVL